MFLYSLYREHFFIRNLLLILQDQLLELSRIRCFKPHQLSRDGMIETEFESMQGQASDRIYVFQSIASVADNGMPQILHVYTYLVFSSRFQVQFNERVSIGSFDGTVMRNGFLSPVICRAGVYIQLTVCQPRNHGSCIFFHLADHYATYRRSVTMPCQLSRSVRWVFSSLANIIKPEVSRSRRCTMCTRCCLPERCTYSFKMV